MLIAVAQQIAEIDNLTQLGYTFCKLGMFFVQSIQCLTNDQEFAFYRSLRPIIPKVGVARHIFCVECYIGASLFDVRQQDAGIMTHRPTRAIH